MNTQKVVLGLLAVAALVAGVVLPRPLPTQVIKEVVEKLGAFPGPSMFSDYFGFNDVRHYYVRQAMNSATITPCVIEAPAGATTTAKFISANVVTSTTSGLTVLTIAKNIARTYATTTSLADVAITASAGGGAGESISITGTSSQGGFVSSVSGSAFQFKPGDRLIFGFAGGQHPTAGYPTGTCQVEFIAVQ